MRKKDWTGNKSTAFTCNGASTFSKVEREINDFYATEPRAVGLLLEQENFCSNIWEPMCGEGHISKELEKAGYNVLSTDLIDRGYGSGAVDFFKCTKVFDGDIITNPPYKYAKESVYQALSLIKDQHKVAMFLKLTFLEGKARKKLFYRYPFKTLYVSSSRLNCARGGDFTSGGSAIAFGWYVWEKGFNGDPIIKWIN
jgi:hypothetical protein